jgi:hypothetical protein
MNLRLFFQEIADNFVKENFKKLSDFLTMQDLLKCGFVYFEYDFDSAVTDLRFKHGLKFMPRDIVQLSVTNEIVVTWKYDKFTTTHMQATTSGAGRVRALVGLYGSD